MVNTAHHDNSDIPPSKYTGPYEGYIASNYRNADTPTQEHTIDMKWPNCYTGGKKEILDVFTTKSASSREGSLAETVGERWSKEERWFSGRPQQD
jgi:hypothetical protein